MLVVANPPPSRRPSSNRPSSAPSARPGTTAPIDRVIVTEPPAEEEQAQEAEETEVAAMSAMVQESTTDQPTTEEPTAPPSVEPTSPPTTRPTHDRDPTSGLRYGDPIYYPNFAMRRCDSDPLYKPKWTTIDEMFASKLKCCEAFFEYVVQQCLGEGFVEENLVTDAPATNAPTSSPIVRPSSFPSIAPSYDSSAVPSLSSEPSAAPVGTPTMDPTMTPTDLPTTTPTEVPTMAPSFTPSMSPITPTASPSSSPTKRPTKRPSHFVQAIVETAPPVYIPKLTDVGVSASASSMVTNTAPKREEGYYSLPSPWKQYFDPKTENYYYHNPETGVTQWDYPKRPVPPPPLLKQEEAPEPYDLELKSEAFQVDSEPTSLVYDANPSGGQGYGWTPTDVPTYSPTYSWPTYSPSFQDDTDPPTISQSPTAYVEKSVGLTIPLDSDATVSEGESITAFGTNPTLTVDGTVGNRYDTMLSVNLGFMKAIPNYDTIILRLYVLEADGLNCGTFQTTLNPWWQQESVTWMNAPGANGEVLGDATVEDGNDWIELNVTNLLTKMVDEAKTLLSIRLHSSEESSRCVFASTGGAPLQQPNFLIMLKPREVNVEEATTST